MAASPVRVTATDLTNVLEGLQALSATRRSPWGTPIPRSARPVFASGFAVAPDVGPTNQVIVMNYQVPRSQSVLICGLVLGYSGGAGAALPGQVLYTVDVDNPFSVPTPGVGFDEKDYNLVPFQLGTFVPGDPWPVEFKHTQNQIIRIKAQTVAGVATGAGNFVYGALIGFQAPPMDWET
jgi:hypothetical protein